MNKNVLQSSFRAHNAELTKAMAYRHWTFSDDPAALSSPSYMMALPLSKVARNKSAAALLTLERMCLAKNIPPPWDYVVPADMAGQSAPAGELPTDATQPPVEGPPSDTAATSPVPTDEVMNEASTPPAASSSTGMTTSLVSEAAGAGVVPDVHEAHDDANAVVSTEALPQTEDALPQTEDALAAEPSPANALSFQVSFTSRAFKRWRQGSL